ncbi:hypothetical protein UPYG_G00305050 [Umbra pygmaea]|uniref:ZAD domain-containing protein n=1 Tax=Umbra pygmaea TaxID=75934 RepID=A0ABD0VZD3_UMBPY
MASRRPADVCRACGGNYPNKSYKHNLFINKTTERYDYTRALEQITGPIVEGDDLPKAVCGRCRTLLRRYYKGSSEVARVGNLFRERACTVSSFFRPPSPVQVDEDFASIDIMLESQAESDAVSSSEFTNKKTTMVLVQSETSRKTRIVTGPMEKVVENIVRGRLHSVPKAVMDVPSLAPLVIKEVLKRVDKECQALTSLEFNSLLRQTSPPALKEFNWDKVLEEWRTNAPTFMSFLSTASTFAKTQTKKTQPAHTKKCTTAMGGACLLRARCEKMNAAMHLNSLLLHHGNAKKACHRRLAEIGICVSRRSTNKKLKGISESQESNFEWMPVTDESWTASADEDLNETSSTSSICSESAVAEACICYPC